MPSSASSSKRTAGSQFPATPRTLGDLPADFPFPAVVTDEHGNELTVDPEMMKDADFLRRVSHLPIVRGTLRAYELSKQRSRVVKYGGDLVESGVKAIGGPVRTAGSQFPATPRTLGDLPAHFPFPAVVTDEHGNELTVDPEMMKDADFLRRVSHLPIVRGTLRAYELSKQRSRVVKYGGDLVESGVKAIGGPVVSRLGARLGEKNVEQLDAFASRQLERLYPTGEDPASREENQQILEELDERERTEWKDMGAEEKSKRRRAYWALRLEEREREMVVNELRQRKGKSRAQDSESNESGDRNGWATGSAPASQAVVATRSSDGFDGRGRSDSDTRAIGPSASTSGSGWGSMLVEAGVTAGGLSAAVSEESMKSLKYCLQWLQYATAHIEHQITILRDLIVKLNHGELELSNAALQSLGLIKGDVVGTIRGVVDVVGKYAGGALPEPARRSVKAFILSLPARWATVNRVGGPTAVGNGAMGSPTGGSFGGSPASPSFSAAHISGGDAAMQHQLRTTSPHRATQAAAARQQQQMQQVATQQAANRILTLAVESLDVLRSVTIIFGESLDRADLWVERLRVLGLQRKRAHEHALAEEAAARIDAGMGGALTSGRHADWESARGMSGLRGASPGADSVASMTTSASGSKRRRTRGDLTSTKSPSPSMRGASDDEGQRTETDSRSAREGAMRNRSRSRSRSGAAATLPAFTPGASGASSSAIASPNHHSSGAHSASQRRKRGSARHYSARTPSANNTPAFAFKELDLHGGGAAKRG
ncbi:Transcription factor Opi1 [Ceraceosorus bombacis]|uniref:Transcription factor Opi1 n=1 Tax=Ceraceosorus bombacis TaxID=401625 RepID=A0A0P1BQS4_9BASI|nr:Transcription factor Opi1 [Ceraceosorus bombacis]